MKVYWFLLFWTILVGVYYYNNPHYIKINRVGDVEKRATRMQCFLMFAPIVFFIGLRSGVMDTEAYIEGFKKAENSIANINWATVEKDKGFYFLQVFTKQFISEDFHVWLFIITLVTCICLARTIKKYSPLFGMSVFLFIASGTFTWLLNGIRQFLAIAIIFFYVDYIAERQFFKYVVVCLMASLIHGTALIMIPIYFVAQLKPFGEKAFLSLFAICGIGVYFEKFTTVLSELFIGTQYEGYIENVVDGNGSNVIRLLVVVIPVLLAFLLKQQVYYEKNKIIDICINMSMINVGLMFISTLTSGLLMGRLADYCGIYNLILLPWLIYKWPKKERELLMLTTIICYIIFFYYQMVVVWNLPYVSDILGINIY